MGGFCCIPGSHKSNYRLPQQIDEASEESPASLFLRRRPVRSSCSPRALTHGTAAWQARHERRSLLYKYCVSNMAWTSRRVQSPADADLTPRQQILFRDPADPFTHFPSLFEESLAA